MTYWPGVNPDYLAISWPDNGEPPPFAGKPCMRIPCPSFMDEHDLQARDQIDLSSIEVPDNPMTRIFASECERLLRQRFENLGLPPDVTVWYDDTPL